MIISFNSGEFFRFILGTKVFGSKYNLSEIIHSSSSIKNLPLLISEKICFILSIEKVFLIIPNEYLSLIFISLSVRNSDDSFPLYSFSENVNKEKKLIDFF